MRSCARVGAVRYGLESGQMSCMEFRLAGTIEVRHPVKPEPDVHLQRVIPLETHKTSPA